MEKKPHTFIPYFLNSWIFIPAIAYFIKVNEYALNLPYADDYDAVLSFLNKFVTVEFREKLSLLILK